MLSNWEFLSRKNSVLFRPIIVDYRERENVISFSTAFIHDYAVVISQPKRRRARHTGNWQRLMNVKRRGEKDIAWSESWKKKKIAKKISRSRKRHDGLFLPVVILHLKWWRARCSLKGTRNTRWFTWGVNHGLLERGSTEIYHNGPSRISRFDFRRVQTSSNIEVVFFSSGNPSQVKLRLFLLLAAMLEWKWVLEAERHERRGEKLIGIKTLNIYN